MLETNTLAASTIILMNFAVLATHSSFVLKLCAKKNICFRNPCYEFNCTPLQVFVVKINDVTINMDRN